MNWKIQARFVLSIILVITLSCIELQEISAQQRIQDRGDFILDIRDAENEDDRYIQRELVSRKVALERLLNNLNDDFNLSFNVNVIFGTWPDNSMPANAVYDSELKSIYIGYGLITSLVELFDDEDLLDDEIDHVFENVKQTVLHEIGHALMNVNNIPIYGDENAEVLADQFYFFVMSELNGNSEELYSVVLHYVSRDRESKATDVVSEHIPDYERGLDYLCWMVGSDTNLLSQAEQQEVLGYRDCKSEYDNLVDAWDDRLEPSFAE
ncbi:MAG: DUF4344 domain-containing metallopeptidase [Rhodothermales bacterium]